MHIPGIRNDLADDLSCDRLSSFLHKVPEASRSPTPVSQQLIDLLMDTSSTWLSPNTEGAWYQPDKHAPCSLGPGLLPNVISTGVRCSERTDIVPVTVDI